MDENVDKNVDKNVGVRDIEGLELVIELWMGMGVVLQAAWAEIYHWAGDYVSFIKENLKKFAFYKDFSKI